MKVSTDAKKWKLVTAKISGLLYDKNVPFDVFFHLLGVVGTFAFFLQHLYAKETKESKQRPKKSSAVHS